jgi:predicted O-methyltransferase YrrM
MPSAPPRADYGLAEFVYAGHYALLHHILTTHKPTGMALEFGVGGGESTSLIAAHMPVIGFDSFKGLPEDWRDGFPAGMFAQDTIPHIPNAELIVGLFEDTLPTFDPPDHVGLVHIDCDLYSSTKTVLDHIRLDPGTIVVFDEWHGFDGCEDHEQRAWREFVAHSDITWDVIGHSFQQWAVRVV